MVTYYRDADEVARTLVNLAEREEAEITRLDEATFRNGRYHVRGEQGSHSRRIMVERKRVLNVRATAYRFAAEQIGFINPEFAAEMARLASRGYPE